MVVLGAAAAAMSAATAAADQGRGGPVERDIEQVTRFFFRLMGQIQIYLSGFLGDDLSACYFTLFCASLLLQDVGSIGHRVWQQKCKRWFYGDLGILQRRQCSIVTPIGTDSNLIAGDYYYWPFGIRVRLLVAKENKKDLMDERCRECSLNLASILGY